MCVKSGKPFRSGAKAARIEYDVPRKVLSGVDSTNRWKSWGSDVSAIVYRPFALFGLFRISPNPFRFSRAVFRFRIATRRFYLD